MKQKRPKIDSELQRPLQDYANLHYDGNVTRAVNELIREKVSFIWASEKQIIVKGEKNGNDKSRT